MLYIVKLIGVGVPLFHAAQVGVFQGCLKVRKTVRFDGSGNIQKKKKYENCSFLPIRILKLRVKY